MTANLSLPSFIAGDPLFGGMRIVQDDYADESGRELSGAQNTLFTIHVDLGAEVGQIRSDNDLSDAGKANKIRSTALATMDKVDKLMNTSPAKWRRKLEDMARRLTSRVPDRPSDPVMADSIRKHIAALPADKRTLFVAKNADDGRVVAAVLDAPDWLSGLDATAYENLRDQAIRAAAPDLVAEYERLKAQIAAIDKTAEGVRIAIRQLLDRTVVTRTVAQTKQ